MTLNSLVNLAKLCVVTQTIEMIIFACFDRIACHLVVVCEGEGVPPNTVVWGQFQQQIALSAK